MEEVEAEFTVESTTFLEKVMEADNEEQMCYKVL